MGRRWLLVLSALVIVASGIAIRVLWTSGSELEGEASYYADRFNGRTTANGETFDINQLTAAHRTLPFGTRVRVTNLKNQKSVVVRINDRGPYAKGRVIDLSPAAARRIDMIGMGVAPVRLEVLETTTVTRGGVR
jgi:rare lipoprotein A